MEDVGGGGGGLSAGDGVEGRLFLPLEPFDRCDEVDMNRRGRIDGVKKWEEACRSMFDEF